MNKIVKKIFIIIIVVCGLIALKMGGKIIINDIFIKNYPERMPSYLLKINSYFNLYEPYIVHYNYGNYYYQKKMYDKAIEKYDEALTYHVDSKNVCKIKINAGLSLLKQIDENDLIGKKELLEKAHKYVNDCLDIKDLKEDTSYLPLILFIIIIVIIIALIILTIVIKKMGRLIPTLNATYIKKLEDLLKKVMEEDIEIRDAYMQMSVIIREFIEKSTKINVLNLSKNEIEKLGIKDLMRLMDEYYPAQFAKNLRNVDVYNALKRTMEVIKTWNWK